MSRYLKYQTADGGIVLVEVEGEAAVPKDVLYFVKAQF
jgi:hypothetical protein